MITNELIKKYSKNSSSLIYVWEFDSPIGNLIAGADKQFLLFVMFGDSKNIEKKFQMLAKELKCSFAKEKNDLLEKFEVELEEYFAGKLKTFMVPIKTFGTEFQKEVWNQLQNISYASTQSYGDLAKDIGRAPSHSRAVGAACGANSHLIVIPCHRLVSSNSMGGFTGGINRKEWLIDHEKKFNV